MRSPQIEAILRPAAVEPVKVILSTPGWRTSSSDTSRSAVRMLNTPCGQADLLADLGEDVRRAGASGDALTITVQPASSAGAHLYAISEAGAFQGMIAPTTPTGSRTMSPTLPLPVRACRSSSNGKVSARPA